MPAEKRCPKNEDASPVALKAPESENQTSAEQGYRAKVKERGLARSFKPGPTDALFYPDFPGGTFLAAIGV